MQNCDKYNWIGGSREKVTKRGEGNGTWVMAHFTAAGFTFQSSLRNSGVNKLKLSRPPEILPMHEAMQRWRLEGAGGGEAVPCVGEMEGKSPQRSLSGVRTMLKPQMAACEDYANKARGRWLSARHFPGNVWGFSPPFYWHRSVYGANHTAPCGCGSEDVKKNQ